MNIIEYLVDFGYRKEDAEEIIAFLKTLPALFSYGVDNIEQKIEVLIERGYTIEEVIKMAKELPSLLSLGIDNIKKKLLDIMGLGYTIEEVIKMTKALPSLFSLSIDNIKQKIEYLKEIGLDFIVLEDTKKLMQSVSLTYARYDYLKELGISITRDNYGRLFYNNGRFTRRYSIGKKELLERYPYQKKNEQHKEASN